MPPLTNSAKRITEKAKSLGFDAVGFADPAAIRNAGQQLQDFIARGYHGDMDWLANNADKRGDPTVLWPEAKTAIVVGHNYGPETNPMSKLALSSAGNISCYAQNKDYHDVMKKKLRQLARWLAETHHCDVKLFVDTAPVMEKPLAEAAGLGWQGKHTCLVSREFGSWLFIGSVFTTLELNNEEKMKSADFASLEPASCDLQQQITEAKNIGSCGTCTACLDICPTAAFTGPGQLDSRRCISYLTIEHKGQIPVEFRKAMGNRIYGCDDCLAVCPWNKFAQESSETAYHPRNELKAPLLKELAKLDDASFRSYFSGSPIKRIGRDRFIRNVLVAIGNSNDASLTESVRPLLHDPSPLVSEMAHWALGELQN